MSEKSMAFCWSTLSHHLDVLDQHRKGNIVNVNLDRSEHLSVHFTILMKLEKSYIMFCSRSMSDK